jgi:hypothetical protein
LRPGRLVTDHPVRELVQELWNVIPQYGAGELDRTWLPRDERFPLAHDLVAVLAEENVRGERHEVPF